MKLQAICKEFICLIFNLGRTYNVKHIITTYNLLTISLIYEMELAVSMYKYHKNILPHELQNIFKMNNFKIKTRSSSKIIMNCCCKFTTYYNKRSLDFGQKSALNFGKDLFFFFFWRSLDFGQKSSLNLPQSNWRQMKIWVKFVDGWIKLQKKPPPPFAKSWLRDWLRGWTLTTILYR